jgi:hypothetical protein
MINDGDGTYTILDTSVGKTGAVVNSAAVASIGTKEYATIADAVSAATENNEVTLLDNCTYAVAISVTVSKSLTFNLNNYTVSGVSWVVTGSDVSVTFKNGTLSGVAADMDATLKVAGANVTLQNVYVNIDSKETVGSANYAIHVLSDNNVAGALTMNGGAAGGQVVGIFVEDGNAVIDGATIVGGTGIEIRAGQLNVKGNAKISGNTTNFNAVANASGTTTTGAAIAVSQHKTNKPITVTLESGTFTGAYAVYEKDLQDSTTEGVSISITGGTYNGMVIKFSTGATLTISGGTFTSKNLTGSNYLAANCTVTTDGKGGSTVTSNDEY